MAEFSVPVVRIEEVNSIEGADFIEAVRIGDFQSITKKGDFKVGDLAVYIPEQSLVPEELLKEMGLEGKLHGSGKNRVKAIKLRGVLSQGLVYPYHNMLVRWNATKRESVVKDIVAGWKPPIEGADVAEVLGITKWEPTLPAQFRGQMARPRGEYNLLNFDIENVKKYPRTIEPGEMVVMTEKIHGTQMQAWYWPETDEFAVTSKGLSQRGFVIEDNEANVNNTYIRTAKKHELEYKVRALASTIPELKAICVLGEVFGKGIQDLHYGSELEFRVFDIYVVAGKPASGHYWWPLHTYAAAKDIGLQSVPVLFYGPFSKEVMLLHTDGKETISGRSLHIREGVVVRPERERVNGGRVCFKSVSADYLLRKGNVTEYN